VRQRSGRAVLQPAVPGAEVDDRRAERPRGAAEPALEEGELVRRVEQVAAHGHGLPTAASRRHAHREGAEQAILAAGTTQHRRPARSSQHALERRRVLARLSKLPQVR